MAALPELIAHGGAVGLAVELGGAAALAAILVWAALRSRGRNDEDGP